MSIDTNEWERWEINRLGGPYRLSFHFEQGDQDPAKWLADVLVTDLSISQGERATPIDGFPEKLEFEERPTVPATPRQNGAGRMLEKSFDLNYAKCVSVRIGFRIPAEGEYHTAHFYFEPHLRKGLFRAID